MEMVRYLVSPEGSGLIWQSERFSNRFFQSRAAGTLKIIFWVGVSVAVFAGLSQLQ